MSKKTLGQVVKEARDALRLTQRGLAAIVDVKASHIAYIENNRRKPSLSLLRRLVEALGLHRREVLFLAHRPSFLRNQAQGIAAIDGYSRRCLDFWLR
jgi:transcriptional regulator with XRE-family HTH domain